MIATGHVVVEPVTHHLNWFMLHTSDGGHQFVRLVVDSGRCSRPGVLMTARHTRSCRAFLALAFGRDDDTLTARRPAYAPPMP